MSPYPIRAGTDTSSVVRILLFGNMFDDRADKERARMSDNDIERPEADSVEQDQDVIPDADENSGTQEEVPLEADEADAAEQRAVVKSDDDEYR